MDDRSRSRRRFFWRRPDQLVLGSAVLLGWAFLMSWWLYHRLGAGLVDVDQTPPAPAEFLLDVNRAAWPELALLPGIGELKAKRIVALRAQLGGFHDDQQLMQARGIGPKTLARIRPFLLPLTERTANTPEERTTPVSP